MLDLDEETSESMSLGFAWEQPLTNLFDLQVSGYYYKIDIENTIIEPSAGYIIFDCYYSETGTSSFCDRIQRESDPTQPLMNYINRGFINRDNQTVRGVDFNVNLQTTLTLFDRPVDIEFDTLAHRPNRVHDTVRQRPGRIRFQRPPPASGTSPSSRPKCA